MSKTRILLAEDDAGHQDLLRMALASVRPDVEICTVANGKECLAKMQAQVFDCCVLDFKLPDYDADKLLRILTKRRHNCPAIVVSSSRDQEVVIKSMRSGGVDFVPKSVATVGDNLWCRIERAIKQHHRDRRKRAQNDRRAQQLALLAETDALTGVQNRRYINRLLKGNRRKAYDRRGPVSLLMLDIDHFKSINDIHGHSVGDEVLRTIAKALRAHVNRADALCRWGGDEFLVVKASTSLAEAVSWAEKARRRIERLKRRFSDRNIPVTASIGIAQCPGQQLTHETIMRTDEAMYLAKAQGRNRVCTWAMAAFQELLETSGAADHEPPERRLNGVLDLCWDELGPTQRGHLGPHSDRVGKAALSVARALGLDRTTQQRLRTATLLHDLGKWVIPEDVLGKPSELSREERQLVRRHAQDGAEMSLQLGADQMTAGWIRYHHRRFDGKDSPAGPRGQAIPLEARILAITDAIDAMTSERPYRSAHSIASAMGELQRERGGQFDPVLVDIALDMLHAEVGAGAAGHGYPLAGGKGHEKGSSNGREAVAGQATFGANT